MNAEKVRANAAAYAEANDGELSDEIQKKLDSLGDDAVADELVLLPEIKDLTFTQKEVEPIIKAVAQKVRAYEYDAGDKDGRKSMKSLAYAVSRCKTTFVKHLATYIDLQEKIASVPLENIKKAKASKKIWENSLDDLRDEAKQPAVDYENKLAEEEAARKLAHQKELDEQEAYDMEELIELRRLKAEREAEVERMAAEVEAKAAEDAWRDKIRQEAAQAAEYEANQKALRAKADVEAQIRNAKEAEERAKREAAEAAQKLKEEYEQKERERLAAEQRLKEEAAARMRDVEHKKQVNNEALYDLLTNSNLTEAYAKQIISCIALGKISHVRIEY